jgi:hypothetical protein
MVRAKLAPAAILIAMLLMPNIASAQCAMCRRALQSPEGQRMVAAFQSGILVLLAAPFSLLGVVAMLVLKMRKRGSFEKF